MQLRQSGNHQYQRWYVASGSGGYQLGACESARGYGATGVGVGGYLVAFLRRTANIMLLLTTWTEHIGSTTALGDGAMSGSHIGYHDNMSGYHAKMCGTGIRYHDRMRGPEIGYHGRINGTVIGCYLHALLWPPVFVSLRCEAVTQPLLHLVKQPRPLVNPSSAPDQPLLDPWLKPPRTLVNPSLTLLDPWSNPGQPSSTLDQTLLNFWSNLTRTPPTLSAIPSRARHPARQTAHAHSRRHA
eukprot:3326972-Rhodomonas_salina.1